MKLKTSEYFRQRKIIIEREKRENAEIKAAVAAILGRLMEQKNYENRLVTNFYRKEIFSA